MLRLVLGFDERCNMLVRNRTQKKFFIVVDIDKTWNNMLLDCISHYTYNNKQHIIICCCMVMTRKDDCCLLFVVGCCCWLLVVNSSSSIGSSNSSRFNSISTVVPQQQWQHSSSSSTVVSNSRKKNQKRFSCTSTLVPPWASSIFKKNSLHTLAPVYFCSSQHTF